MRRETFGGLVRRHREAAKMSMGDLASILSKRVVEVSDIERGLVPPPDENTIVMIAAAIRVNGWMLLAAAKEAMVRVVIESPYAGEVEANGLYLRRAIRDSVLRGESPYASHRMLTDAFDDDVPEEREIGIRCGYAQRAAADLVVFYLDRGFSRGMRDALEHARARSLPFRFRRFPEHTRYPEPAYECAMTYGYVRGMFEAGRYVDDELALGIIETSKDSQP